MLSILIPAYNYNITKLVTDLQKQASHLDIAFEIIVMEDGSRFYLDENKTVATLNHVSYVLLKDNIGRSAIRNRLADEARYEHLLFLDCDAGVTDDFIQQYVSYCDNQSIVSGGRIYEKDIDPQYSLISKYGREKEENRAEKLQKKGKYQPFTSPNFLIPKSIFCRVRFDETIVGYGHEDTIFGIMLRRAGFEVKRINNPVIHIGIEDNHDFIAKTEKALHNLYLLHQSGKYPELEKESKIISYYLTFKHLHLTTLLSLFHKLFGSLIKRSLLKANPSLFLFDLYKLGVICSYS